MARSTRATPVDSSYVVAKTRDEDDAENSEESRSMRHGDLKALVTKAPAVPLEDDSVGNNSSCTSPIAR